MFSAYTAPARQKKASTIFPRPTAGSLRPIVHGQTLKYNMKVRAGRGFSLEELKAGDSSAEELANATQVQDPYLPIVREQPAVELVKVKDEMKSFNAYGKLRIERTNARHVGVRKGARKKFTQEVPFQSKDKDISLAKVFLYVATEDEAFMAFNHEMDAYSIQNEMKSTSMPSESLESTCMEDMPLAGKSMNEWMAEFDAIAREVEAELSSREIGCNLVEVLDAVNTVLFKSRGFKSLFGIVNGKCVDDPRTKASDINSKSLSGLEIATNKDIVGIALANLIRFHWKCASRANHGLMLTSPLRSIDSSNVYLLRPQDLRLAIMAPERLLILQPHNWSLRRDHGMMLYYSREYEEAVKELSICVAFAPEEESEILEPFVEKLHLLCVESSWNKSLGHKCHLSVP
ncbi:hypothetical protein RND71_004935 [Anisodus tanguticus]|uniref:Uncharacterized protein n=1 Tax=Anisodus tanguticus TaxID=243964 RepID=A0AAE1VL15_9SOLA|nr:hypothetical protein RND71_004935 [Anisodus tanguticus]